MNLIPQLWSITDNVYIFYIDFQTWSVPASHKPASGCIQMNVSNGAQPWFGSLSYTRSANTLTSCFESMFSIIVTFPFLCSSISTLETHLTISSEHIVQIVCTNPQPFSIHLENPQRTTICELLPASVDILRRSPIRNRSINITVSYIRVARLLNHSRYPFLRWTLNCSKANSSRTDTFSNLLTLITKCSTKWNVIVYYRYEPTAENNSTTFLLNSHTSASIAFNSSLVHPCFQLYDTTAPINELCMAWILEISGDCLYFLARSIKSHAMESTLSI